MHRTKQNTRAPARILATAMGFLGLLLLMTGCDAEEAVQDGANDIEASLLQDQLDAAVEAGVTGAVLLVQDPGADPIVISGGVADREAKMPMDTEDAFRIGSLTKTYVAAVVMQLVDEGSVGLDDPIEQHLPGLLPNGEEISVGDLLGHRSGLAEYLQDPKVREPYLAGDYAYDWKPTELIEIGVRLGPAAEPGTQAVYSNTNYTVLGLMIEEVTGNSLEHEIQSRVIEPLGLERTTFATDGKMVEPYARGYLAGDGPLLDVTEVSPTHYWAAGNLVSTASDVAAFYRALLDGDVVSDESLDAMKAYVEESEVVDRGLGLAHNEESCGDWYGHDGGVPGYNSLVRNMENGRQVVMLMNSIALDDTAGSPEAQGALAQLVESAMCR